jgi:SAM-dependent methyltransferase
MANTSRDSIRSYNAAFDEWGRLDAPEGRLELHRTLALLERVLPDEGPVLDLGGGPGRYAIELARRGVRVALADLSPEQLAIARERIAEAGVGEHIESVREVDARDLSVYANASFAAVLALGPFYHLVDARDRVLAASEIARVLRPGGLVVAAFVPRLSGLAGLLVRAAWDPSQVDPAALREVFERGVFHNAAPRGFQEGWYPEPAELVELFEGVGFRTAELRSLRGLAAGNEKAWLQVAEQSPETHAAFEEIHDELATAPEVVATGSHALYVGHLST